jgi:putative tryptophan/tyrosine transport system substrate-binding protein
VPGILIRSFPVFLLVAASAAGPAWAGAHVSIVKGRSLAPYEQAIQGIRESLLEADPTLEVDVHDLKGKKEEAGRALAQELRQAGSKLVITVGSEAAQAMKEELKDLPMICAMAYDPIEEGLVDPSHHYAVYLKVSFEKRFAILKKVLPNFKTLALIHRKDTKAAVLKEARVAADKAGLELAVLELGSMDHFSRVLEEASKKSQALIMILDQELYNQATAKELLLFSARKKYPIIAFAPNYVQAGALMSVSSDFRGNGAAAGRMAAQLLKGNGLADRFVQTEQVRIAWNQRIAGIFGISAAVPQREFDEIH